MKAPSQKAENYVIKTSKSGRELIEKAKKAIKGKELFPEKLELGKNLKF